MRFGETILSKNNELFAVLIRSQSKKKFAFRREIAKDPESVVKPIL